MDLWQKFIETGSVNDYLNYKKQEQELTDADYDQRTYNKRADDRGE
jgi:hypothetical protein